MERRLIHRIPDTQPEDDWPLGERHDFLAGPRGQHGILSQEEMLLTSGWKKKIKDFSFGEKKLGDIRKELDLDFMGIPSRGRDRTNREHVVFQDTQLDMKNIEEEIRIFQQKQKLYSLLLKLFGAQ